MLPIVIRTLKLFAIALGALFPSIFFSCFVPYPATDSFGGFGRPAWGLILFTLPFALLMPIQIRIVGKFDKDKARNRQE